MLLKCKFEFPWGSHPSGINKVKSKSTSKSPRLSWPTKTLWLSHVCIRLAATESSWIETSCMSGSCLCDCVWYVPECPLQPPVGQSSRSQIWIQTSLWWWDHWCPSACRMLEGKEGRKVGTSAETRLWACKRLQNSTGRKRHAYTLNSTSFAGGVREIVSIFAAVLFSLHDALRRKRLLFSSHALMPILLSECGLVKKSLRILFPCETCKPPRC